MHSDRIRCIAARHSSQHDVTVFYRVGRRNFYLTLKLYVTASDVQGILGRQNEVNNLTLYGTSPINFSYAF